MNNTVFSDSIIQNNILPDIDNLLTKEYNSDEDIINALNILENSWKKLPIPKEYEEALNMLVTDKISIDKIFKAVPYIYTLIFSMKAITYLFFKGKQFHTEVSLVSSVIKINDDLAEDKTMSKLITEQISFAQDIIMASSESNVEIIKNEMKKNTDGFKSIYK